MPICPILVSGVHDFSLFASEGYLSPEVLSDQTKCFRAYAYNGEMQEQVLKCQSL